MITVMPPGPLRGASADNLHPDEKKALVAWFGLPPKGEHFMLLYGPEGVGKSYIAASIVNFHQGAGWQMAWLDCAMWPSDWGESAEMAEDAMRCHALVIDDLGREPANIRRDVARVIVHRFNAGLWTIFTTNLTVDEEDADSCELTTTYSRALRSRILGMSDCILIDDKDRRLT